jgi:hypothetical protein
MSGEHGLTQAAVPQTGSIKAYEPAAGGDYVYDSAPAQVRRCRAGHRYARPGYYHQEADLSFITFANGTTKAFNKSGQDITAQLPA